MTRFSAPQRSQICVSVAVKRWQSKDVRLRDAPILSQTHRRGGRFASTRNFTCSAGFRDGPGGAPHIQEMPRCRLFQGRGESCRTCSGVMPPATISSTWLTVIRIPRIVGSPPQTFLVRDTIDMHESIKNLRRTQSDFATQNVLNGRH